MATAEVVQDRLHAMYRAVHARALDLDVFPLPRRVLAHLAETEPARAARVSPPRR